MWFFQEIYKVRAAGFPLFEIKNLINFSFISTSVGSNFVQKFGWILISRFEDLYTVGFVEDWSLIFLKKNRRSKTSKFGFAMFDKFEVQNFWVRPTSNFNLQHNSVAIIPIQLIDDK